MAWQKARYRDFTGGENLKVLPETLLPNQVISAQNCFITNEGLLQTREGKQKVNLTSLGSGPIISIHRYSKENGTKYLVAQHGTTLYAAEWDGINQFYTFDVIKSGVDPAKLRSEVWKDLLILTNGVDMPFTFDGITCSDLVNAYKSKLIALYASRLWLVDVDTGFLENSNLEDPTTWTETGSYKVRDGEGDHIVALSPQPGGMVIFKQNTVQTLYGSSRFNISIGEPFSRHIGCMATDSVLHDGFFLGKDNFYTFTLNSVSPLPQTHTQILDTMSQAQKQAVFSCAHPIYRRALINLGDSGLRTLCIDAKWNGAITSWTHLNASCFAVADDRDDPGTFIWGDATEGYVYSYGGLTDDGSYIETRIKSTYMEHNSIRRKEWSSFIPEVEAMENGVTYRLYYNYDIDYSTHGGMLTDSYSRNILLFGSDEWNTATYGTDFRINEPFFLHDARGNRISFELVCNNKVRFNGFTSKFREVGATI